MLICDHIDAGFGSELVKIPYSDPQFVKFPVILPVKNQFRVKRDFHVR